MLVVILITTAVVQFIYIGFSGFNLESIIIKEYKDSETLFFNEVNDAIYQIYRLIEDKETIKDLPENLEYLYYVTDGETTFTNRQGFEKSDFAQYKDAFFAHENHVWSYGETTSKSLGGRNYIDEDITMYIAFPNDYMIEHQNEWDAGREILIPHVILFVTCLAISLLLVGYSIAVTGRKPEDDFLHTNWLDNIYSEILFGAFIPIGVIWIMVVIEGPYFPKPDLYNAMNKLTSREMFYLLLVGGVTAIVTILCGLILLTISRKIKAGRLIKHSITYSFFHRILDFIKSLFDGRRYDNVPLTKSLYNRQITFIIASAILVFLTLLFLLLPPLLLLPPILEMLLIYWYIKYNNETFEKINKGFDESLEEQMKSERMKINLVTNVSHDLKTPLTSIISYIDLLSKEDLSEISRDYVNILSEKANRLKNIVADLFDLAKSTSGDINLDFEALDIKKLIEQTLGDMEDDIEKSGLQIKTNFPEGPVNIVSDGKKLYRVFQNIIDNALKYSLDGTRVFVELQEEDGTAVATIKNTSSYEMDFNQDEILQRFSRGDKSRTTDGSGLGLSIAESFTNVCGGILKIDIDGDMFKVIISFRLA